MRRNELRRSESKGGVKTFSRIPHTMTPTCVEDCAIQKKQKKEREIDDGVFFSGKRARKEKEKEKHVFVALSSNFSIHSWIFPTYDKRGERSKGLFSSFDMCDREEFAWIARALLVLRTTNSPLLYSPLLRNVVWEIGVPRGARKRGEKRKYASSLLLFFCRETVGTNKGESPKKAAVVRRNKEV